MVYTLVPSLIVFPSTEKWYSCPSGSVNTKCSFATSCVPEDSKLPDWSNFADNGEAEVLWSSVDVFDSVETFDATESIFVSWFRSKKDY